MEVTVRQVSWADAARELMAVRERVFIVEQHVPAELERDSLDPECLHVLACEPSGRAIGTGRLTPDGRIGRMAVLAEVRQRGVGRLLLSALLELARQRGDAEVHLHAQEHARDFYVRQGFEPEGEAFCEAGIAHIGMRMKLVPG